MQRISFYALILFFAIVPVLAHAAPSDAEAPKVLLPKPRPGMSTTDSNTSEILLPKPRPETAVKGKDDSAANKSAAVDDKAAAANAKVDEPNSNTETADKKSATGAKPDQIGPAINSGEAALVSPDTDEAAPLPAYPPRARIVMGKPHTYSIGEEDTLLDVARYFRLGFVETRAANPDVDPWTPLPGQEIIIPSFKLLPRAPQRGIVVNLAQMRMYYFYDSKKEPVTFPIGIGREGLQTPTGETSIIRKTASPTWFPTDRMREEKPWLPAAVPAGPSNPLGTHALYLGWPTFLIHGSNKPWAIGRRVSSGCMRMYPEDIKALFDMVPVGTKVTVVDQPILVGWVGDELYLEAHPSKNQSNDIEITGEHAIKGISPGLRKVIADAAGVSAEQIDWDVAEKIVEQRLGYPAVIANEKTPVVEQKKKPAQAEYRYN